MVVHLRLTLFVLTANARVLDTGPVRRACRGTASNGSQREDMKVVVGAVDVVALLRLALVVTTAITALTRTPAANCSTVV